MLVLRLPPADTQDMRLIASNVDPDDVLEYRARAIGAMFSLIGIGLGFPLGALLGVHGRWLLLFCPFTGLAAGFIVYRISRGVAAGTGQVIQAFIQPSGNSVPYAPTHSYEQSLAARGDVESALNAYEARMLARPDDLELKSQAAELHARAGDARRAVILLMAVRSQDGAPRSRELYATQRLIDLFLGPLEDSGRAMVELRRLVDRYPGTPEAAGAAAALARLKLERRTAEA